VPLFCVITDFTAHPFWAFPNVDRYFVASARVAEELAGHGVRPDSIQVSGIPIDPRFAQTIGRPAARARFGLDPDRPVVLVMGGGSGVGPLVELAARLARLPLAPTVVVVCGTNRKLQRDVAQLGPRIVALGFTDQVDVLLEACDVVVSKAGGLTCSEAVVKRAPLVVFRPTPGQEVRNAEFLEAAGAAMHADSLDEVEHWVQRWIAHPAERERVREAAAKIATPNAAQEIARRVLGALPAALARSA
jgi:processive 1,2-diacylglycerol beta-glucosyltransferase